MNTFKGTPGPWVNYGGDNASCEVGAGDTTICVDRSDKNTGKYVIERHEMEANAQTISAVPDMIEALLSSYEMISSLYKMLPIQNMLNPIDKKLWDDYLNLQVANEKALSKALN